MLAVSTACQGPDPEPYEIPRPIEDYDAGSPPDGGLGADTPDEIGACSGERNPFAIEAPTPDFELDDYRFELRGENLRSVSGTVLRMRNVSDPAVIARAVLLGSGAFLDPECVTEQGETSFHWDGIVCKEAPGTLWNTFVVEPENLGGYAWLVEHGTDVRITGYEIERFDDYGPDGRYFVDGGDDGLTGQVSLFVTDICLEARP